MLTLKYNLFELVVPTVGTKTEELANNSDPDSWKNRHITARYDISHVLRVAGVQGEHGDGDELDDRPQEPETEDVVEIFEEIPLFQCVPLPGMTKGGGGGRGEGGDGER